MIGRTNVIHSAWTSLKKQKQKNRFPVASTCTPVRYCASWKKQCPKTSWYRPISVTSTLLPIAICVLKSHAASLQPCRSETAVTHSQRSSVPKLQHLTAPPFHMPATVLGQ